MSWLFSEFSTTCQEYIPNLLLPPRKNGRSVATNKGWEGIKLASEQSFVVIGYGVQKHKQKLGYLDEDVTRVETIEPTQEIPKETNSRKVAIKTEV